MSPEHREWLERHIEARRQHLRAVIDLTQEQLRRSRELLSISEGLLQQSAAVIRHSQPPKE